MTTLAPGTRRRLPRVLAAVATVGIVGLLLASPLLGGDAATRVELADRFVPPLWSGGDWTHPLGTDALGRDMLARLIAGARVSLFIGVTVVAASAAIGTTVGLIAGYAGGRVDVLLMRLADAQLAFPGLVLVLAVVGALGPSVGTMIAVLVALGWMVFARLARSIAVHLAGTGHVRAAELLGCSHTRVIVRHLLPAISGPLVAQTTLEVGRVILTEAALSYLGLGIQPPDASWGLMVAENRPYLATAWWAVTLPGLALTASVLLTNMLAGRLRTRLDPAAREAVTARMLRRRPARPVAEGVTVR